MLGVKWNDRLLKKTYARRVQQQEMHGTIMIKYVPLIVVIILPDSCYFGQTETHYQIITEVNQLCLCIKRLYCASLLLCDHNMVRRQKTYPT